MVVGTRVMTSSEPEVDCEQQIRPGPEIDAVVLLAAMPMCNKTVSCAPYTETNNRAAVGWGVGRATLLRSEGADEVQNNRSVRDWLSSSEDVL